MRERKKEREEREKLRALTMNEIVEGACAENERQRAREKVLHSERKQGALTLGVHAVQWAKWQILN